jgi:hypothetical protein
MATVASPYGLRPINLIGGRPNPGGAMREVPMGPTGNTGTAIYTGDIILIGASAAGQPTAASATPTTSTGGVIGVCVGVSYVDPVLKYVVHAQYLPANAVNNGYTNIIVKVNDDPQQLYQIQAAGSVASTTRGYQVAVENFGGSTATGLSTLRAGTPARTNSLALRVVDFVDAGSAFTDLIVKFNTGVHMYDTITPTVA